jgi:putative PIN family toxin of toxin-antitoxin system
MLVALDTNILFSALISPVGSPARIYDAWQEGRFELVTCEEQLNEIRAASRYPKLRAILQPHRVGRMLNAMQRARIVKDIPRKYNVDDPTDSYLLDLADHARANYLVTGDKRAGLLAKRRAGGVRIITAAKFCAEVLD